MDYTPSFSNITWAGVRIDLRGDDGSLVFTRVDDVGELVKGALKDTYDRAAAAMSRREKISEGAWRGFNAWETEVAWPQCKKVPYLGKTNQPDVEAHPLYAATTDYRASVVPFISALNAAGYRTHWTP